MEINDYDIPQEKNNYSIKKNPFFIFFIGLSSLLVVGTIIGLFIDGLEDSNVETEYSNLVFNSIITTSKLILPYLMTHFE